MTPVPQTFAFTSATLQAPSLHALLGNLSEFQLHVGKDGTYLTGLGYRQEVAYAFTRLIYYWSAKTDLLYDPGLPSGSYYLSSVGGQPTLQVGDERIVLPDGPAEVVLVENRADEEE